MKCWFMCLALLLGSVVQATPVEIVFWHSMAGQLGTEVQKLTHDFNNSQTEYVLKPVYKGNYLESLTSFAAAFRAKQPPALVQVFEVGTATMLAPKGIIKPVAELMREQGLSLPITSMFPVVRTAYSKNGQLMAMPFNISIPVIFYNADALAKLGYTAATFPRTWVELEVLAAKLRQAGFPCAYTTAYPAWILIESFAALHGLAMIDAQGDHAVYNNKMTVSHLQRLLRWQQLHYFEYGGRADDATTLFTSGRCPLFSQSSGGYASLAALVPFKVGVGALPWDEQASGHRFNNVAGGAAIWAVAGQPPAVYQGIARFFAYLARPDVQQYWHQQTGYLPLGVNGSYQAIAQQSRHPTLALAKFELAAPGIRLSVQNQIRLINDEAVEEIFAGIKTPQQAMDDAVSRANHALFRFMRNTRLGKNN